MTFTCPGCMKRFEATRVREFCTAACRNDWTKRDRAHRMQVRRQFREKTPRADGMHWVSGGRQSIAFGLSDQPDRQ